MKKRELKLKKYIDCYIGKPYEEIMEEWGGSGWTSDNCTLFYDKHYSFIFKDEIAFIVEEGKVSDTGITECILGIGLRNIFYQENETRTTKANHY